MFCFCLCFQCWSDCNYTKSLCAGQPGVSLPGQFFSLPGVSVLVRPGGCLRSLCWPGLWSLGYNCVGNVDSLSGVSMICQFVSFRGVCASQVWDLQGFFVPCKHGCVPGVSVLVYL